MQDTTTTTLQTQTIIQTVAGGCLEDMVLITYSMCLKNHRGEGPATLESLGQRKGKKGIGPLWTIVTSS